MAAAADEGMGETGAPGGAGGAADDGGFPLSFTKEEVPALVKADSALTSDLEAREPGDYGSGPRIMSPPGEGPPVPEGLQVGSVLDAIAHAFTGGTPVSSGPSHYDLRIVDESGAIDEDFPVLDPHVHIGSVGVERFGLTKKGRTTVVLFVHLPGTFLDLPPARRAEAHSIELDCYYPGSAVPSFGVTVHS